MKPEILMLQQEDLIKAGLLDMKKILEVTEHTFKMLGEGKVKQPSKIQLCIPDKENWESYGMSMPAYIGDDDPVIGFKWAAESVHNPGNGLPYGIDVVLLSNPYNMFPKAVLDGTITTAMRTSAAAGICAKYTAKKESEVATLVGAGVIGRTMIMSIGETVPQLKKMYLYDLDAKKAADLIQEFDCKYNDIELVVAEDLEAAVKESDLVVTETTARKPFIKNEWLKKNMTCIQMEACSFEENLLQDNDLLVMDSYDQISMHRKSVAELKAAGKLTLDDVTQIQDLATGAKPGRTSEEQFIYCTTMGMGCVDIAIANMLYKSAKAMGLGKTFNLWDEPIWY